MDVLDRSYTKKLFKGLSSGYLSSTVTDNADGSKTLTINFVNGDKADITFNSVKGDKGDTGASVQDIKIKEISGARHLIVTLDDGTEIDAGKMPEGSGSGTTDYTDLNNKPSINGVQLEGDKSLTDLGITNYDDTQIKSDIKTLQDTKQNSTDTNLTTNEKTVTGAINEIYGNSLDVVGFSSDYKNIILNRKNGLNPITIPLVSIISHSKLQELFDVDITDIGNAKTLVYDSTTQKHKYVDSTGTDELVKMEASGEAHYLSDLLDGITLVNDGGFVKAKKLDGQEVTITEINYLKGLTMNVMDLVNMFSNGGVKIINTPVNTYADLLTYDKTSLIDGISYLVYVLTDETHDNAKTTYLIDKTSSVPTYFGFAGEHRDFTTSPINLANEVTGKLGTSNIDVDSLFALLSIDDTYKTLTDVNKVFGTHGANAMYTELVEGIGKKANDTDLTAHTDNTDIHVTAEEKKQFKNKVDKGTVINTKPTSSGAVSQFMVWEDSKGNNFGGMNFVTGDGIGRQFRMSDYEDHMTFIKSNGGTGVEERYKILDERDIINKLDNTIILNNADEVNSFNKGYQSFMVEPSVADEIGLPNSPSSTWFCIHYSHSKGFEYPSQIAFEYAGLERIMYRTCGNGVWHNWRKVCTTSVADVPVTNIAPANTTTFINFAGNPNCNYRVKNGVCYVDLEGISIAYSGELVRTGVYLPKSSNYQGGTFLSGGGDATPHAYVFALRDTGELCFDVKDVNTALYGSFSYPVA